jgi:hypothetical protein
MNTSSACKLLAWHSAEEENLDKLLNIKDEKWGTHVCKSKPKTKKVSVQVVEDEISQKDAHSVCDETRIFFTETQPGDHGTHICQVTKRLGKKGRFHTRRWAD